MPEHLGIGGDNIGEVWEKATFLDRGDDSEVRSWRGMVIKRYPNIDQAQLSLYREATDGAAGILNGTVLNTPLGSLSVAVNPVNKVIESKTDLTMYSVSPLIFGETMHELLLRENQKAFNEFEATLESKSRDLIKQLRIGGIFIIPYNVLLVGSGRRQSLVITDIASYVSRIARL